MADRECINVKVGILTVSDSCYSGLATDHSGENLKHLVESGKYFRGTVVTKDIIPDEYDQIKAKLLHWSDHLKLDLILTTGGTGFSSRDVTPEATKSVIEKEALGMAIAMLKGSLEITPLAMLTRLICGIRGKTLIINLPGSMKGSSECLHIASVGIPHAVDLLRGHKTSVEKTHSALQAEGIKSSHGTHHSQHKLLTNLQVLDGALSEEAASHLQDIESVIDTDERQSDALKNLHFLGTAPPRNAVFPQVVKPVRSLTTDDDSSSLSSAIQLWKTLLSLPEETRQTLINSIGSLSSLSSSDSVFNPPQASGCSVYSNDNQTEASENFTNTSPFSNDVQTSQASTRNVPAESTTSLYSYLHSLQNSSAGPTNVQVVRPQIMHSATHPSSSYSSVSQNTEMLTANSASSLTIQNLRPYYLLSGNLSSGDQAMKLPVISAQDLISTSSTFHQSVTKLLPNVHTQSSATPCVAPLTSYFNQNLIPATSHNASTPSSTSYYSQSWKPELSHNSSSPSALSASYLNHNWKHTTSHNSPLQSDQSILMSTEQRETSRFGQEPKSEDEEDFDYKVFPDYDTSVKAAANAISTREIKPVTESTDTPVVQIFLPCSKHSNPGEENAAVSYHGNHNQVMNVFQSLGQAGMEDEVSVNDGSTESYHYFSLDKAEEADVSVEDSESSLLEPAVSYQTMASASPQDFDVTDFTYSAYQNADMTSDDDNSDVSEHSQPMYENTTWDENGLRTPDNQENPASDNISLNRDSPGVSQRLDNVDPTATTVTNYSDNFAEKPPAHLTKSSEPSVKTIKCAKIHSLKSQGQLLYVPVGAALKSFINEHPLIQGIYLHKGKREIKKQLAQLCRQNDQGDKMTSWRRGKEILERNRFDDYFELTEEGKKEQEEVGAARKRDQYVVNWYVWCPGHSNCKRKCGGFGVCLEKCKGMLHKQDRHNCSLMINMKLFLSDLSTWRVNITGSHIPPGSAVVWVPPALYTVQTTVSKPKDQFAPHKTHSKSSPKRNSPKKSANSSENGDGKCSPSKTKLRLDLDFPKEATSSIPSKKRISKMLSSLKRRREERQSTQRHHNSKSQVCVSNHTKAKDNTDDNGVELAILTSSSNCDTQIICSTTQSSDLTQQMFFNQNLMASSSSFSFKDLDSFTNRKENCKKSKRKFLSQSLMNLLGSSQLDKLPSLSSSDVNNHSFISVSHVNNHPSTSRSEVYVDLEHPPNFVLQSACDVPQGQPTASISGAPSVVSIMLEPPVTPPPHIPSTPTSQPALYDAKLTWPQESCGNISLVDASSCINPDFDQPFLSANTLTEILQQAKSCTGQDNLQQLNEFPDDKVQDANSAETSTHHVSQVLLETRNGLPNDLLPSENLHNDPTNYLSNLPLQSSSTHEDFPPPSPSESSRKSAAIASIIRSLCSTSENFEHESFPPSPGPGVDLSEAHHAATTEDHTESLPSYQEAAAALAQQLCLIQQLDTRPDCHQ